MFDRVLWVVSRYLRPSYEGQERHVKRLFWTSILIILAYGVFRCFFRSVKNDESWYIHAAGVMADCLREGLWFGNEAVGLHGFIFKLPAALLFLVTGNSVFVATFTTVVFAAISFALCFRMIKRVMNSGLWGLVGAWIMASSYFFMWTCSRYLREIPVILALLILLNMILDKRNKWLLGLGLLLVLDAKEYVFFAVIPAFVIWAFVVEFQANAGHTTEKLMFNVFERVFAGVLPATIFIFLMFFTGVIPLNPYLVSFFGLKSNGLTYVLKAFFPVAMSINDANCDNHVVLLDQCGPGNAYIRAISKINVGSDATLYTSSVMHTLYWGYGILHVGIRCVNLVLMYCGKLLYQSTFSFVGVPKLIAMPALAMSVLQYKRWMKEGKLVPLILPILLWVYMMLFVMRISNGRYLIPVLPVISMFFIMFMRDGVAHQKFACWTLFVTSCTVVAGFAFDHKSVLLKVIVNIIILGAMSFAVISSRRRNRLVECVSASVSILVISICLVISLASCLTVKGQVGNSILFGPNMECKRIVREFAAADKIWLNRMAWSKLLDFHRGERLPTPEWRWPMVSWLPKKKMLHVYDNQKTFSFDWESVDEFESIIHERGIVHVGLIVSLVDTFSFPGQDKLVLLKSVDWLELEDVVPFKNKTLYKFRVVGRGNG